MPVSQKKSMQQENTCSKKLQRPPGSAATATANATSSSSCSASSNSCSSSLSGADLTFGGLPTPRLEATYEPVIVKEARYIAITMMKVSSPGDGHRPTAGGGTLHTGRCYEFSTV